MNSIRVATNLENMENLENSGNLENRQHLRENSGKFELLYKKPRKLRENEKMLHDHQQKCTLSNFSLLSCSGKKLKYPGNLRENSGNLVSQKCGHPVYCSAHCMLTLRKILVSDFFSEYPL